MLAVLVFSFCRGGEQKASVAAAAAPSATGYDLSTPKKFIMSESLHEISGITFWRGNPDTLYAIEDEDGKLFSFHLGDGRFPHRKFGKKGDYEDVTILDDKEFVVLRSDGSLFVFPVGGGMGEKDVRKYEHILPAGEYEGLYGDGNRLIALCKNCPDDDQRDDVSAYVLRYNDKHALAVTDHFRIDISGVKLKSIHKKARFHPSAIARHPITHDWYILSSVNKILLVLDDKWNIKASYPLPPTLYKQPEGLAFDKKGNMYISNEGGEGNANVLFLAYRS